MKERLQKIISAAGLASRRAAEKYISDGRVSVNGITAKLGDSADPDIDDIRLDGKCVRPQEKMVYIMLNKPRGFVTTLSDEQRRRTVAELVADAPCRVYPVGRLDLDSEGLLILTNDGAFANAMMHPAHEVDKVYETVVSGDAEAALPILRGAMDIDGYRIRPAKADIVGTEGERTLLNITIHEGRNRQVRKMCAAAGLAVHRLRRISEGSLSLGSLPLGHWRFLDENEMEILQNVILTGSKQS